MTLSAYAEEAFRKEIEKVGDYSLRMQLLHLCEAVVNAPERKRPIFTTRAMHTQDCEAADNNEDRR
jgi:hypothetical protein